MPVRLSITVKNNVLALANLAMVAGQIGKPSSGVNPLRGQNNVQGACDMAGAE
jgi:predicted molibdopterin-dependent oxidoreductase YjgC